MIIFGIVAEFLNVKFLEPELFLTRYSFYFVMAIMSVAAYSLDKEFSGFTFPQKFQNLPFKKLALKAYFILGWFFTHASMKSKFIFLDETENTLSAASSIFHFNRLWTIVELNSRSNFLEPVNWTFHMGSVTAAYFLSVIHSISGYSYLNCSLLNYLFVFLLCFSLTRNSFIGFVDVIVIITLCLFSPTLYPLIFSSSYAPLTCFFLFWSIFLYQSFYSEQAPKNYRILLYASIVALYLFGDIIWISIGSAFFLATIICKPKTMRYFLLPYTALLIIVILKLIASKVIVYTAGQHIRNIFADNTFFLFISILLGVIFLLCVIDKIRINSRIFIKRDQRSIIYPVITLCLINNYLILVCWVFDRSVISNCLINIFLSVVFIFVFIRSRVKIHYKVLSVCLLLFLHVFSFRLLQPCLTKDINNFKYSLLTAAMELNSIQPHKSINVTANFNKTISLLNIRSISADRALKYHRYLKNDLLRNEISKIYFFFDKISLKENEVRTLLNKFNSKIIFESKIGNDRLSVYASSI